MNVFTSCFYFFVKPEPFFQDSLNGKAQKNCIYLKYYDIFLLHSCEITVLIKNPLNSSVSIFFNKCM